MLTAEFQVNRSEIHTLIHKFNHSDIRSTEALMQKLFGRKRIVGQIFLHLLSWAPYGKRNDSYIYKSARELAHELGCSEKSVERSRDLLTETAFDTVKMKANGAPTIHYRLNYIKLVEALAGAFDTDAHTIMAMLDDIRNERAQKQSKQEQKQPKKKQEPEMPPPFTADELEAMEASTPFLDEPLWMPEPMSEPQAKPKPEGKMEPAVKTEPEAKIEPAVKTEPEAKIEPEVTLEPEPAALNRAVAEITSAPEQPDAPKSMRRLEPSTRENPITVKHREMFADLKAVEKEISDMENHLEKLKKLRFAKFHRLRDFQEEHQLGDFATQKHYRENWGKRNFFDTFPDPLTGEVLSETEDKMSETDMLMQMVQSMEIVQEPGKPLQCRFRFGQNGEMHSVNLSETITALDDSSNTERIPTSPRSVGDGTGARAREETDISDRPTGITNKPPRGNSEKIHRDPSKGDYQFFDPKADFSTPPGTWDAEGFKAICSALNTSPGTIQGWVDDYGFEKVKSLYELACEKQKNGGIERSMFGFIREQLTKTYPENQSNSEITLDSFLSGKYGAALKRMMDKKNQTNDQD